MAHHPNAWKGINIVIFGKTPLLPMQIEQGFAQGSSNNEVRIDSFEDYEQAYDHCKAYRNVGLILITDQLGELHPLNIFQQLAKPFEETRGPCFGILLHEKGETLTGHSALRFSRGRLMDYIPAKGLTDRLTAARALSTLWSQYIESVEAFLFPDALADTLREVADSSIDRGRRIFMERTTLCLSQVLAVSWWETLALRWRPVMKALSKADPSLWKTQRNLHRLGESIITDDSLTHTAAIVASKAALVTRLAGLLDLFEKQTDEVGVRAILKEIAQFAKPGASGLIRQTSKMGDQIVRFWMERNDIRGQDQVSVA